ncbi:hypothetical protein ANCDUO_00037 [Ancylostoma duodenale]|uniref:Uncharacterized protein n=1 Tax=Ancylostoma duodenale TaxID=51022 RepID=A0A0C2HD41_9BILA|nr:hypothetical protein ANCDUO_00037 [Ancylostoma duodenale]
MAPDTDFEEAQAALKSLRAKTLAQIDYPTTAAASYGEPVDNAVESFGSKELPVEQQESSGEQKLTTTGSHADVEFSSPDSEGSGQDELNRSVEKVSGEVGQYSPDEHPSTYGEVAYEGQQQTVRGTAAAPGYDDNSNDGYSSVISQPSTTLSDSGYDSVAQSTTTIADAGYDGVPQNTIIPEQGYGVAQQTTVMPDVGYEGAGQNTIPQGTGYDVVAQSTPVPELNYDRAPQPSSYGVPQTPGYEEVPQYSSSYSYTVPDESSKTTASVMGAYSPVEQKQLQDFSEAVKERSDNDQAVVSPPISKKISSSNEADATKKYKEAPDSTSTKRKSALIGPPADRAPPRRGAVEGTCSLTGAHAHNELPLPH